VRVMVGDKETGNFRPNDPVNRAEMAVVMANLLNLDYNYYEATCPFDDVYDWARGYVGACYANGIVSGRGDGIYDPGTTVTAVEAASMLMRALGYFKYQSDYADGFEVSTVRQATKIGLFDGVNSQTNAPLTRNQVAQMALNAIRSGMVEPDGNALNFVDANGNVIATGGKVNYVYVTSTKPFATAIDNVGATSIGSSNTGAIVELGEQLYDGKLKLNDDGRDAFQRPARVWEYDGKAIGTYVKKELIRQEYTAGVTGKDLYDLLSQDTIKTYGFTIAVDGETEKDVLTSVAGKPEDLYYFTRDNLLRTNTKKVGGTGKGVLTQVFVDTEKKEVTIAIINTYLAVADDDYNEKKDEVDFTVWAIEEYKNTEAYVKNTNSLKDDVSYTESFTVKGEDFDIKDVLEDDVVLVYVAEGEIKEIFDPEVIDDTAISAFKKGDWVNAGGTQYDYASAARYDDEVLDYYDNVNMKDTSYRIFLDKYGYLIGLEIIEEPDQYVFLTGIDGNTSNLSNKTADGNVLFLDGTSATIRIDMTKSCNATGVKGTLGTGSLMNTWCKYSVTNDLYTLTEIAKTEAQFNVKGNKTGQGRNFDLDQENKLLYWSDGVKDPADPGYDEDAVVNEQVVELDKKHVTLNGLTDPATGLPFVDTATTTNPMKKVYGNDDSVFLTAETKMIKADDHNNAQTIIISGVDGRTVGIQDANINAWNAAAVVASDNDYKNTDPRLDYVSQGVYTLFKDNGYVIAAVVVGEDEGTTSTYAYITSSSPSREEYKSNDAKASSDGEWTWYRDVIIDGEAATLKEKDDTNPYLNSKEMTRGSWWNVKFDADGYVRKATKVDFVDVDGAQFVSNIDWVQNSVVRYETVVLCHDLTDQEYSITAKGNTLEIDNATGRKYAFAVAPSAKIALAQDTAIYRNGVKTGGVAEMDEITYFDNGAKGLEKAVKALEYNSNFKGWVSAVFDGGLATSVVIWDRTEADIEVGGSSAADGKTYNLYLYDDLYNEQGGQWYGDWATVSVGSDDEGVERTGTRVNGKYGQAMRYRITSGSDVFVYDPDVTGAGEVLWTVPGTLGVTARRNTVSFEMPNGDVHMGLTTGWDDDVIVGTVNKNAGNVTATFNGIAQDKAIRDLKIGSQITVVIRPVKEARAVELVKGEKYTVTLGSNSESKTVTCQEDNTGLYLSVTYKVTKADLENNYIEVISIVPEGTTPPVPAGEVKLTYTVTGTGKDDITVTAPETVEEGETATVTVTAANETTYTISINDVPQTVAADGKYTVTAGKEDIKIAIVATKKGEEPGPGEEVTALTVASGVKTTLPENIADEITLTVTGGTKNLWYHVTGGSLGAHCAAQADVDGNLMFTYTLSAGDKANGLTITAAQKNFLENPDTGKPCLFGMVEGVPGLVDYDVLTIKGMSARAVVDNNAVTGEVGSLYEMNIGGKPFYFVSRIINGKKVMALDATTQSEIDAINDAIQVATPDPSTGLVKADFAIEDEHTSGTATVTDATDTENSQVKFDLGEPKAIGVKLPTEITVDGKVTAKVNWYCNGEYVDPATDDIYAKAKAPNSGYTYEIVQPQVVMENNIPAVAFPVDVVSTTKMGTTDTTTVDNNIEMNRVVVQESGYQTTQEPPADPNSNGVELVDGKYVVKYYAKDGEPGQAQIRDMIAKDLGAAKVVVQAGGAGNSGLQAGVSYSSAEPTTFKDIDLVAQAKVYYENEPIGWINIGDDGEQVTETFSGFKKGETLIGGTTKDIKYGEALGTPELNGTTKKYEYTLATETFGITDFYFYHAIRIRVAEGENGKTVTFAASSDVTKQADLDALNAGTINAVVPGTKLAVKGADNTNPGLFVLRINGEDQGEPTQKAAGTIVNSYGEVAVLDTMVGAEDDETYAGVVEFEEAGPLVKVTLLKGTSETGTSYYKACGEELEISGLTNGLVYIDDVTVNSSDAEHCCPVENGKVTYTVPAGLTADEIAAGITLREAYVLTYSDKVSGVKYAKNADKYGTAVTTITSGHFVTVGTNIYLIAAEPNTVLTSATLGDALVREPKIDSAGKFGYNFTMPGKNVTDITSGVKATCAAYDAGQDPNNLRIAGGTYAFSVVVDGTDAAPVFTKWADNSKGEGEIASLKNSLSVKIAADATKDTETGKGYKVTVTASAAVTAGGDYYAVLTVGDMTATHKITVADPNPSGLTAPNVTAKIGSALGNVSLTGNDLSGEVVGKWYENGSEVADPDTGKMTLGKTYKLEFDNLTPADGKTFIGATAPEVAGMQGQFSPDGKKLTYTVDIPASLAVVVTPATASGIGTELAELTLTASFGENETFAPDVSGVTWTWKAKIGNDEQTLTDSNNDGELALTSDDYLTNETDTDVTINYTVAAKLTSDQTPLGEGAATLTSKPSKTLTLPSGYSFTYNDGTEDVTVTDDVDQGVALPVDTSVTITVGTSANTFYIKTGENEYKKAGQTFDCVMSEDHNFSDIENDKYYCFTADAATSTAKNGVTYSSSALTATYAKADESVTVNVSGSGTAGSDTGNGGATIAATTDGDLTCTAVMEGGSDGTITDPGNGQQFVTKKCTITLAGTASKADIKITVTIS